MRQIALRRNAANFVLAIVLCAPAARAQLTLGQGGLTVYDAANGITWLSNFNLAATNTFGLPVCTATSDPKTCINASGSASYQAAAAWVKAMNAANYLGHNNWQIPSSPIDDPTCSFIGPQTNSFGWGCSASAFGSLYNALGLSAPNTAVPASTGKTGPFTNFQPDLYWTQTSLPQPTGDVGCCATISFNSGWQGSNIASNFLFLLPMIPGKLAGTPAASGTGLQINPGGQTIYDPIANVTWLADANLPASNAFGLPACKAPGSPKLCVSSNGSMNWDSATQFITNMNAASYLGQSNWEMPAADPNCASSYICSVTNAPFQSLYYTQLGLAPGTPVVVAPDVAVGPFTNIRPYLYWTCEGTSIAAPCGSAVPAPGFEWSFWFSNGFQGTDVLAHDMYVAAYYPGAPSGLNCTYALSSSGQSFPSQGGSGSTSIVTAAGCPWAIAPVPPGVTLTSAASGSGPATVSFSITANSGSDLTESFAIAGINFTIDEEALSISGLARIGSLAHLAAEGGWLTTFTFVNKGASSAIARVNLNAPDGSALTVPVNLPQQTQLAGSILASSLDQTIAPNASFLMQATGPATVPYVEGSAQLAANGNVDGFAIFHYTPSNQEAVVPLETRNAPSYVLAFDNTNSVLTGVAIENASSSSATIPVVIRDDTGKLLANRSVTLNAQGHTSFVLSTQFPATSNIRGTLEFDTPGFGSSASAPISVLGIRYTPPGTLTTIPALANVTNAGGVMAHLAAGGEWQTTFVLVNTGTNAATANLNFYDDNGSPLPEQLSFPQSRTALVFPATTYSQSIASGASVWVVVTGLAAFANTGSAQLTTTGQVGGFAIFRYNPNGQEAVVPLESRNASSFIIPFDNTAGTATGIALGNASTNAVNIPVTLRDDMGNTLTTNSIHLNANGHTSFVLSQMFSQTGGLRGSAEFAVPSSAALGVLGIRSPAALTFTTLPALAK